MFGVGLAIALVTARGGAIALASETDGAASEFLAPGETIIGPPRSEAAERYAPVRSTAMRRCPRCGKYHRQRAGAYAPHDGRGSNCPPGPPSWHDLPQRTPGEARPIDAPAEELPHEAQPLEELFPPTDPLQTQPTDTRGQGAAGDTSTDVDRALQQGQSGGAASDTNPGTSGEQSALGNTASAASNAPETIGDFFGGGGPGVIVVSGPTTVGPGTPYTVSLPGSISPLNGLVPINLPGGFPSTATPVAFFTNDTPPYFPPDSVSSLQGGGTVNGQFLTAQANGTVSSFAIALANDPSFSNNVSAYLIAINPDGTPLPTGQVAAGGGTTTFQSSTANFDAGSSPPTSQVAPRNLTGADQFHLNWLYRYTPNVYQSSVVVIRTLNPGDAGGVVVGRMKIAENTSPIPRDRIFFNYNGFANVPLVPGGVNVYRYTPGFEKTFFNRLASWEMRFPFASTLDTNFVAGGVTSTGKIRFGNMAMALKFLLASTTNWAFSGGLQIAVPTANNINVALTNGTPVARVGNSSVHLMPFLGALYSPNERFFTQGFLQLDFDTNGNPVDFNPTFTGNTLIPAGRINSPTFLYADLNVGYWLYRSRARNPRVMAFAPAFELHYNRSLQNSDVLVNRNVIIGDFFNNFELLNFTVGCYTQLSPMSILTVGYSAPLGGGQDQQFSGEMRISFNRRF